MKKILKRITSFVCALVLVLGMGVIAACDPTANTSGSNSTPTPGSTGGTSNSTDSGTSTNSASSNSTSTNSASSNSTSTNSASSNSTSTNSASSNSTSTNSASSNSTSTNTAPESTGGSSSVNTPGGTDTPSQEFVGYNSIITHAAGTVTYVFEAECTDLRNKTGPGYSGSATGSAMAVGGFTGMSNGGGVSYLAGEDVSVNFLVASDRDVTNATLTFRVGAEFINMLLDPSNYTIRIDRVTDADLEDFSKGGALGRWDEFFLNYDFAGNGIPDTRDTYYINSWDCGEIAINAEGSVDVTGIDDFVITTKLNLKRGVNSISFITANSDSPGLGTLGAISPVIDCIKITTDAQLGMYGQQENGYGTNGCKIV